MKPPFTAALSRTLCTLCLAATPGAAALAQPAATAPRAITAPAPVAPVARLRPVVERAWARATPPGVDVGAIYFTVRNPDPQADEIIGLSSPASERAEIHETRMSGGIMRMRQLTAAPVPAGGVLSLEPGGTHVMLIGLRSPLVAGASVPLVLNFRHAGEVTASAVVQALGSEPHNH